MLFTELPAIPQPARCRSSSSPAQRLCPAAAYKDDGKSGKSLSSSVSKQHSEQGMIRNWKQKSLFTIPNFTPNGLVWTRFWRAEGAPLIVSAGWMTEESRVGWLEEMVITQNKGPWSGGGILYGKRASCCMIEFWNYDFVGSPMMQNKILSVIFESTFEAIGMVNMFSGSALTCNDQNIMCKAKQKQVG